MIGFEVLHYQTMDDTVACVESILKHVEDPRIVIVDNGSPNGSGLKLAEKYKDSKNVKCLLLEQNLGFAKGNNLGYRYLKENAACDFICCINNDTLLVEDAMQQKLEKIYDEESFGVLAPKVLLKDGSVQSFNPHLQERAYYEKEIDALQGSETLRQYQKKVGFLTLMQGVFPRLMGGLRRFRQRVRKPYPQRMKNVVLHGCFLVFSKDFLQRFENAFDERTFMYREEELLYISVMRAGLSTLYCEDISIKHLEDSATNASHPDRESKYQFMKTHQLASTKILLEELEKGYEQE